MTNERWQRVDELYHAALEREGTERAAFLETACKGDDALRREVESLLASDDEAGSFLAESAMSVAAGELAQSPAPSRVGARLGSYELLAPLGAGGMGEVYRARDVRLGRIVAIKILASHVADDPEFRRRFAREARTISQLSHPHICALYDVGQQPPSAGAGPGVDYLVLEHLEGETLAERLARGALPLSTALQIAVQIASALDTAHRAGVVHRDLKPGNVFLVRGASGAATAKLLDFGVAKAAAVSIGETIGSDLTATGTILGTVQYMAPEQLEGREADARTDIFSFGAVLYEMLTGRKAFAGDSRASLMAAILERDPHPVATLQPETPPLLDRIVAACLAKNPDDRCQTARDLLRELTWVRDGGIATTTTRDLAGNGSRRAIRWWAAAVAVAGLAVVAIYLSRPQALPSAPTVSFSIYPPEGTRFPRGAADLEVSPDGSRLVFSVISDGTRRLWLRRFDSVTSRVIAGSDGGESPFWSPDGHSIAFFAQGKLKRVAETGGAPQVVCDVRRGASGTWNRDGTILFASAEGDPIRSVAATGGVTTAATTLDPSRKEFAHVRPVFLPDGRRFLYWARSIDPEHTGIYQGSLDASATRRLFSADSKVSLAGTHIFSLSQGSLIAQTFDVDRAEVRGEPVAVADQITSDTIRGDAFSAAANGVLAYRSASSDSELIWFDRSGKQIGLFPAEGDYHNPWLSPDERRLAVEKTDPATGNHTIWVLELARGVSSRLVFDGAGAHVPVWSPDGRRIVFSSNRLGGVDLYQIQADGTGGDELVLSSTDRFPMSVTDWSLDGRLLLYHFEHHGQTDLALLPVSPVSKPQEFTQSASNERDGQFSPDIRWIAYSSNESGSWEVYVRRFPGAHGKWRVSTRGGAQPRWRRDGQELFYLAPDGKLMAVDVKASGATFETGAPRELFKTSITAFNRRNQYVVTGDGQRFLVNLSAEDRNSAPITVVLNWQPMPKK